MRIILLISIVLNAALLATLLLWSGSRQPRSAGGLRQASAATISTNPVRILKTNVLVRPRLMAWGEVESADYATYIENLRGLGMPENTIRDVIIADLDQLFAERRREIIAEQDFEWWRSQPSAAYQSNALARAWALEEERTTLLTRLLGPNWKADRLDQQPDPVPLSGPVLSVLPEEVKKTVQTIAVQSAERARQYLAQAQAANQPASELELAKLREQTRQQLAQVLTPQQLEEFLLRNSHNAVQLRRDLAGLELSPDEFRQLFRATDEIDRAIQLRYAGNDAQTQQQRAALQQQRAQAIREAIGPERYETYVMLHDPLYAQSMQTAQTAGLPEQSAAALYEITRATTDEVERIRNDPTLTEGQKQEQIIEAEMEQQRARALVLGDQAEAQTPTQLVPALRSHVKRPGETLGELAFRYGVSIPQIREVNPGLDINRAPPGTVLNVPTVATRPGPPLPPGAVPR